MRISCKVITGLFPTLHPRIEYQHLDELVSVYTMDNHRDVQAMKQYTLDGICDHNHRTLSCHYCSLEQVMLMAHPLHLLPRILYHLVSIRLSKWNTQVCVDIEELLTLAGTEDEIHVRGGLCPSTNFE